MKTRRCEVCGVRESLRGGFFANFPKDELRCKTWVKQVGNEDLVRVHIEKLHEERHVCGDHFDRSDFGKKGKRLTPPLLDHQMTEFPLHVAASKQADRLDYNNHGVIVILDLTDSSPQPGVFRYGPVCAGNHDLGAHHTFDNMCELQDTNCRDGTASIMLQSSNEKDIQWFPVTNKGVQIKISTRESLYFYLTRGKDIKFKPQYYIIYGDWGGVLNRYKVSVSIYPEPGARPIYWLDYYKWGSVDRKIVGESLLESYRVRDFSLTWNETKGYVNWQPRYPGDKLGRLLTTNGIVDKRFPIRYLGVYGGNLASPAWVQLSGYLMAYRGKCREDLPPLPTQVPEDIGGRHKIQLYNFAERMDEFGYNMTRVPDPTVNDYGGDYFEYPGQP